MSDVVKLMSRAEVYEKEQKIKQARIEAEINKFEEAEKRNQRLKNFSLSEIEASKGADNAKKMIGVLERDAALIRQAVTFINPTLSAVCPLCPGALYLIGAASGTGKSTTTAAIAHALMKQGKRTFVISNEETAAKIYARVACSELGIDFNQYIQDKLPSSVRKMVAMEIIKIEPMITVADDPVGSTTIEAIEKLLHEIDRSGSYSCVVIDFAQRIVKSTKNPTIERTMALYNFKDMITDYAQHAKTPIVLMTQLIPLSSDETERNFEQRIKWARGLYEAAAAVVEVIKIKGMPVSNFYVAKGRFFKNEVTISCKYENGMFSHVTKEELKDLRDKMNLDRLKELSSSIEDKTNSNEDVI